MKVLDGIVLAAYVIGLIVLCFFIHCRLDIYFLVLGFAVAAMSLVAMILQGKTKEKVQKEIQ